MENHRKAYMEEAYELVAELEASLLELESRTDDIELIGRVFRALHTIKGSGAMFGFDEIASFTHEVESVFDLIRNGKLSVTKEIIDLVLYAGDQIRRMLDAADGGAPVDPIKTREILTSFRELLADHTEDTEIPADQEITSEEVRKTSWNISFRPPADIFATGTNPILILNALKELGECIITARTDAIPLLEVFNPEKCYTYWDIILTTTKSVQSINDVFIFVEDDSEIDIVCIGEESMDSSDEEGYRKIGEILVEQGYVSSDELTSVLKEQKRLGQMLIDAELVDQDVLDSALAEQARIRTRQDRRREATLASSIRVPVERLDCLVDLVGELVTIQARLSQKASVTHDTQLTSISEEVERLTSGLRDNTMRIRMIPIGTVLGTYKRLVRDLSSELRKDVVLTTEGEDTELDKTVIERLNDPIVHIIRNCIDHGIESPEVRKSMGKPAQGVIHLSAFHSAANVLIRISDDGAGLDIEKIRSKAIEKKIITENEHPSEADIYAYIFSPGFSTAKNITDVSGRGVGLDVVKRSVEGLKGIVEVDSERGKGTTVTLKLPLTLAIIDGLLIKLDEGFFVLPLSTVEECVELSGDELDKTRARNMMSLRGTLIPYMDLRQVFSIKGNLPAIEQVIIVSGSQVGLGVDRVIGQHQTVIKSLGKFYRNMKGVSGATIIGDGTVALIIDVNQVIEMMNDE